MHLNPWIMQCSAVTCSAVQSSAGEEGGTWSAMLSTVATSVQASRAKQGLAECR